MKRFFKVFFISLILINCLFSSKNLSAQSINRLPQELQSLVSNLVKKDKSVYNCVLSVKSVDDSFSWSGAAGIANHTDNIPMIKDTPFFIASITKLFTATVIMRLYEQDLISLNDPMSRYLSDSIIHDIHVYKGIDYSHEITIKQLLAHTSGIADYYSEKPKKGKSLFEIFLENPERSWTIEDTIDRARNDLTPNFQPGTNVSYSDTNFQLLGKIIENITNESLHKVYEEYIFKPLNLQHTWLINYSEPMINSILPIADLYDDANIISKIRYNGSYWADGGIISTAEDCIIFLKALNEGKLISQNTLNMMHDWHKLDFPLQYGFGTMYFQLPDFMNFGPDSSFMGTFWINRVFSLLFCRSKSLYVWYY